MTIKFSKVDNPLFTLFSIYNSRRNKTRHFGQFWEHFGPIHSDYFGYSPMVQQTNRQTETHAYTTQEHVRSSSNIANCVISDMVGYSKVEGCIHSFVVFGFSKDQGMFWYSNVFKWNKNKEVEHFSTSLFQLKFWSLQKIS